VSVLSKEAAEKLLEQCVAHHDFNDLINALSWYMKSAGRNVVEAPTSHGVVRIELTNGAK